MNGFLQNLKYDLPAGIVVFFVAVPLCLGIALASGAPLFSGVVSGIIGGIIVGLLSGSALGVSGPAAGLSAVVLSSLDSLNGSWEAFLLAVVIAGLLQLIAGFLGGGVIAYYFPSSVIKGMLTGIGIIIILKQIPFAFGLNGTTKVMLMEGGDNIFYPVLNIFQSIKLGPTLIALLSLLILISWEYFLVSKHKIFQLLQGPIVVVLLGILLVALDQHNIISFPLDNKDLVAIPIANSSSGFLNHFSFPDFSQIFNIEIYKIGLIVALIASIETLLCLEATDKLDPQKRVSPTDRELKAQGIGNVLCGMLGGLPVTQVIVRSSANITFGARTKMSTIFHGILLLLCVAAIPHILNMIPLATLAAILFVVGFKLANPNLFVTMYRLGWEQFVPFIITVIGIVAIDLLFGVTIGMIMAIFIILRHHYKNSHEKFNYIEDEHKKIYLTLAEEVSFLNKGSIMREFRNIPKDASVVIDLSRSKVLDYDVQEAIQNFLIAAKGKRISVELIPGDNLDVDFNKRSTTSTHA